MSRAKPKSRALLLILTGRDKSDGTIDAGTGNVHFAHGLPKIPTLRERVSRRHVAADFMALVSADRDTRYSGFPANPSDQNSGFSAESR